VTTDRWAIERAVKASTLPVNSRLIVYTLLTHTTNGTVMVPPRHAPSLTVLATETGMSRSTVADHLNRLETGGWIVRYRPTTREAITDNQCTGYALGIPANAISPVRESDGGSPGAGLGVVRDTDQGGGPGNGLPEQDPLFSGSPGAGPVRESDGGSPGAGHNPTYSTSSSPTEKKEGGPGGGGSGAGASTTTKKSAADDEHPRFAEWYAAYPRKKGPGAARASFNKAVKKADPQTLIDAAKRYAESDPQVLRGFAKYPATWLNQECWLDEPDPQPHRSNGAGSSAVPPRHDYDASKFFGQRTRT
jgi:hypothetical protein